MSGMRMALWSPIRPLCPAALPKAGPGRIQGYLESLRKRGEPLPEPADTEIIEVKQCPSFPFFREKELVAALKRLGYEEDHRTGSHIRHRDPLHRRLTVPDHKGTLRAILRHEVPKLTPERDRGPGKRGRPGFPRAASLGTLTSARKKYKRSGPGVDGERRRG